MSGAEQQATGYLEIGGLSKSFGTVKALDDISLSIGKGEFACFLGPSGCGKTTLLRAIAGLEVQDRGQILQGGRDISALPIRERDFGIVFQSYALFPNLTIADNVGYGLRNTGKRAAEVAKRVGETLEMVGLGDYGQRYPAQLSGGQQQRVALARAIALTPSLLLLDEPLSALDAQVRTRLRDEIKALQRELGVTTIMVTHDQDEAMAIADRIVVMNNGVIEQTGTPEEIYARPASLFVAGFIGEMNLLPGTLEKADTVRVGPVALRSEMRTDLRSGSEVTVAVRPGQLTLAAQTSCSGPFLEGRVLNSSFRGYFRRFQVALAQTEGAILAVDMPAGDAMDIRPDERVAVGLPRDPVPVFGKQGMT